MGEVHTPDRIMASLGWEVLNGHRIKIACVTVGTEMPAPFEPAYFLRATPAREAAEDLVEAAKAVGAVLQAEMTRSGGQPFTGIWSIPALGVRTTCSEALDKLDAALARVKGGAA